MVAMGKLSEKTFVVFEVKEYKPNLESLLKAEMQNHLEAVCSAISPSALLVLKGFMFALHIDSVLKLWLIYTLEGQYLPYTTKVIYLFIYFFNAA